MEQIKITVIEDKEHLEFERTLYLGYLGLSYVLYDNDGKTILSNKPDINVSDRDIQDIIFKYRNMNSEKELHHKLRNGQEIVICVIDSPKDKETIKNTIIDNLINENYIKECKEIDGDIIINLYNSQVFKIKVEQIVRVPIKSEEIF